MSTIEAAVGALRAGEVIVIPTDTVYGLAVDATRAGGTGRLFALKARPLDVAIPVLAADADQAFALAAEVPPAARRLAAELWPGGLTIVVPRRPGLGIDLGGPDDATIGLRVPDHDVPRALAARVGPLATTSANRHGEPTPVTAGEVAAVFGDGIGVVLDGGACAGAPSTVVVCTGAAVRVVREGAVAAEVIRSILG